MHCIASLHCATVRDVSQDGGRVLAAFTYVDTR